MTRTIEIVIATNGEIKIDAVGFKGADCEQATQFLEAALGITVQKRRTPEYYQQQRKEQRISQ